MTDSFDLPANLDDMFKDSSTPPTVNNASPTETPSLLSETPSLPSEEPSSAPSTYDLPTNLDDLFAKPSVVPEEKIDAFKELQTPQFGADGSPVEGSLASKKGLLADPLTIKALENFDLTADIDGNMLALSKHVADTVGGFDMVENEDAVLVKKYRSITPQMVQNMPRATLERLLQRQDVQTALAVDSVVRKRLAQDAEALAILRGELPLVLSAEGAMATSKRILEGDRKQSAFEEVAGITPDPDPSVSMVTGLLTAGQRGAKLQSASKEVANALAVLGGGEGFAGPDFEPDLEKALQFFGTAVEKAKKGEAIPRSGEADEFIKGLSEIDKLGLREGLVEAGKIIFDNPLGAIAITQEVLAEQAGPLVVSLVARRFLGPSAGAAVMVATTYAQERLAINQEVRENIQDKFGYDIYTEDGLRAFVYDRKALQEFSDFNIKRAVPIAIAAATGFGLLRTISKAKIARVAKAAAGIAGTAALEGAGELTAQLWSKNKYLLSDVVLEAMAGGHPVNVGMEAYIAGAADLKDFKHAKAAKVWLESGKETADIINGIPVEKLSTAADVLADKLREEGISTVFIPADELKAFDQDGAVTETLGLVSEEVQKAAIAGQDVAIDATTYIRHILGKEGFEALQKHTKFSEEGMTAAQAEQYDAEGIGEQIYENIDKSINTQIQGLEVSIDPEQLNKLNDDTDAIREQITNQLEATGVYTGAKADLFAQITAQRYATRAVRQTEATGQPVDAMQLFLDDNLQIEAAGAVADAQGFEQAIEANQEELSQAAIKRENREITEEQYLETISRLKPVTPYKQEDLPVPATKKEMTNALREGQQKRVGQGKEFIGQDVGLRLDIPAYQNYDTWVPTIHNPAGKPVAHEAAAYITGNIKFTQPGDKAESKAGRVGRGEATKAPFAQIDGTLKSVSPSTVRKKMNEIFNNPEWVQVGYDPRRHTFFYNRETQQPIVGATEVMQLGPLVMAKDAQYGVTDQFLFQEGFEQEAASIQAKPIEVKGTAAGGKVSNWDFAEVLTQRHLDKHGRVLDVTNENDRALVLEAMQQEYNEQFLQQDTGAGWYVEDIVKAVETTKLILPELSVPSNRDLFLTLAALLSPQEKPTQNWEKALVAMELFLKNGVMPDKKPNGKGFGVNAKALPLTQYLIDTLGSVEAALEWIQAPHTGREIAEMRKASGVYKEGNTTLPVKDFLASEVALGDTVLGIYMFGPKVGDFMMNSTGIDQTAVTVDLWLARTYNRLTGRLTDVGPKARTQKNIISEVRSKGERKLIKSLITELATNNGVDASAMQAALWYFEQRLYRNHGINSESTNFSGAAETAAKKRKISVPGTTEPISSISEIEAGKLQKQSQTVDLEQTGPADAPRGRFIPSDMMPDQDGNPVNLIQIFEKADATTFLHESGHFWLEQLKADTEAIGGNFKADFNTVINWLGTNSLSIKEEAIRRARTAKDKASVTALQQMTEAQVKTYIKTANLRGEGHTRWLSVSMHEQFARGTENYFASGKAPSISLASAFNAFKVWILSVYRRMGSLPDINFSPEVKNVLDRMLATDEEISAVESQYSMAALLTTAKEAGMTPKKFQQYQKTVAESRQQSRANHLAAHMREIAQEKTTEWKAQRETFREEITTEVANLTRFKILYTLAEGKLADGSSVTGMERVLPMDQKTLITLLDDLGMQLKDLPKVRNKAIYAKSKKDGDTSSPGAVAAVFGYENVTEMLTEMLDVGTNARASFEATVNLELDSRMKEEFGSLESVENEEAIASIHGDHTANLLTAELTALRTTEPAFKDAFIRQYAFEQISKMKNNDIRHNTFSNAEQRHAKLAGRALARGDRAEAYKHQFHRLVNHRMASEALKARADITKKSRYLRDMKKNKKRPALEAKYLSSIQAILEFTDLSVPVSERARLTAELSALNTFIEDAETNDGAVLQLPAWLLAKDALTNVRNMTYQEFSELHESVKSLEKQGKLAKKIRIGNENRDRQEVINTLIEKLSTRDQTRISKILGPYGGKPTAFANIRVGILSALADMDASLTRVEFLLEALDGEPIGPWHQTLYQPFIDALNEKNVLTEETLNLVKTSINNLPKKVRNNLESLVDVGELGTPNMKITRSSLIMLALNTGNESNLDKVIRGFGGDPDNNVKGLEWNINQELLDKAFEQFTEEEWTLIKNIWEHADKLKPKAFSIYEKENGIAPLEIEPRVVTTKFGDIKGGYFPIMYDHTRPYDGSSDAETKSTALEKMQAEVGKATVNSSFTKSRTKFAAPIMLDFAHITSGLNNTIHFITHYEAVRNATKVLKDRSLRSELETKVGKDYATMLDQWVGAVASNGGDLPPMDWLDKTISWTARNTTMAVLGASYTTLSAQTLGLTSALDTLAKDEDGYNPATLLSVKKDLLHGLGLAMSPENYKLVIEKSAFMQYRRDNYDREVQAVLLKAKTRLKDKYLTINDKSIFEWGMQAIAEAQFFSVDLPTWTAAYNRALRNDPGDETRAIAYADRTVRLSQSSGNLMDLSQTHRSAVGVKKALVMFYTWFSALYGMLRSTSSEFSANVKSTPISAVSRAATRLFVLLTLQSIGMGLIRGELPAWEPEDEDEEDTLDYLLKETLLTGFGTVPILRMVVTPMLEKWGFSGSPTSMVGEAFTETATSLSYFLDEDSPATEDMSNTELIEKLKPLIFLGAAAIKAPGIQITRSLDGAAAWFDEVDGWLYSDLIRGYDPKRAARRDGY